MPSEKPNDAIEPDWKSFFSSLDKLNTFTELCNTALRRETKAVEAYNAYKQARNLLDELDRKDNKLDGAVEEANDEDEERRVSKIKKFEAFALQESEKGYPYLYEMSTIRLWSIMNDIIDNVCLCSMASRNEHLQSRDVQKLAVPFALAIGGTKEEINEYVLEQLKRVIVTPKLKGVERLEVLLQNFGLNGHVEGIVFKVMTELVAVRNTTVHRNNIADARLIETCPWLNLEKGQAINTRKIPFDCYVFASLWYLLELQLRWERLKGTAVDDASIVKAQKHFIGFLDRYHLYPTGDQIKDPMPVAS